jgi:hypothetical protein
MARSLTTLYPNKQDHAVHNALTPLYCMSCLVSHVDLFKVGFGSGQGWVVGHLARPAPDPCIVSGQVGLACASLLDALGRGFLALSKKPWPVPDPWIVAGQKLWHVLVHRIDRVGFFSGGLGWSGRWPMIRSSCTYDLATRTTRSNTHDATTLLTDQRWLLNRLNVTHVGATTTRM